MPTPNDPFHYEFRLNPKENEAMAQISAPDRIIPPEIEILGEENVQLYKSILEFATDIEKFSEVKLIIYGDDAELNVNIANKLISLNGYNVKANENSMRFPPVKAINYQFRTTFLLQEEMLNITSDDVFTNVFFDEETLKVIKHIKINFETNHNDFLVDFIKKNNVVSLMELIGLSNKFDLELKSNATLNYRDRNDNKTNMLSEFVDKDANDIKQFFKERKYKLKGNHLVTVWDFKSQHKFHALQKLFFSKRAIYILVVRPQDSINNIYNKINSIKALSGNSPIVLTYVYDNILDKEVKHAIVGIEKEETNLTALFFKIDNQIYKDLRETIDSLIIQDKELDHSLSSDFPLSWVNIRYAINLARKKRKYLSVEDFYNLCNEFGIDNEKEQDLLLATLHQLGVLLHITDDNPVLMDNIFINYHWINDAINAVLEVADKMPKPGVMTIENINSIWSSKEYKFDVGKLLSILVKPSIGLCYSINKNQYVFPLFLTNIPKNYTPGNIYNSGLIMRIFKYHPFLPAELIHRLLMEWSDKDDILTCHRNAVIIEKNDSMVSIISNIISNKIEVVVKGGNMENNINILVVIRNLLQYINKLYSNIFSNELMPCACRMCSQSEDPHYYDYNKLKERMIIKGDKKIECPISYEDISVTKITGFSESISKYEIYDLVSINKLDEAFEILLSKYDNNDLRLLSSRHEDLKNQQKKGVISYDNYQLEKNKIRQALLDLINII